MTMTPPPLPDAPQPQQPPQIPDAPQPQASAPEQPEQVEQAVPAGEQPSDIQDPPFQAEAAPPEPQVEESSPESNMHAGLADLTPEQRAQLRDALGAFDAGERAPALEQHPSMYPGAADLETMPTDAKLNATVYVRQTENNEMKAFGPGDPIPEWARVQIHNPDVWSDPEVPEGAEESRDSRTLTRDELARMERDQIALYADTKGVAVNDTDTKQDIINNLLAK